MPVFIPTLPSRAASKGCNGPQIPPLTRPDNQGNVARRGSAGLFLPPQRDDALEVAGLRKKVEGLHGRERIAGGEELFQVAHLRRGIA